MATGPEHYRAAEFAIENAKDAEGGSDKERFFLAVAQVHATLAHAAAIGTYGTEEARTGADTAAWELAAGEHAAQAQRQRETKQAAAAETTPVVTR